jgi:hypothetical protein
MEETIVRNELKKEITDEACSQNSKGNAPDTHCLFCLETATKTATI